MKCSSKVEMRKMPPIEVLRMLVFFLLPVASTKTSLASKSVVSLDLGTRPVMDVVRLLQDMKGQLQIELDDDGKVHDELSCWCETAKKDLSIDIATGISEKTRLSTLIDETSAEISELKEKRHATSEEVNSDKRSLQQAREIRMKESEDFAKQETDYLEAIGAVNGAITVLSKHHTPDLAQLRSAAHRLLHSRVVQTSRGVTREAAVTLQALLQTRDSDSSFLQKPGYQSFAPQSGQVFGILNQMKDDFDESLTDIRTSEARRAQEFLEVKQAKIEEIDLGEKELTKIDADLADEMELHTYATQEKASAVEHLNDDNGFMANVNKKCTAGAAEYDARVKSRMQEMSAVDEAIEILNSDESFAVFDKLSFIQTTKATHQEKMRRRAVLMLQRVAGQSGAAQLATLVVSARLDTFTTVKEQIDKMVSELKKQQQDEVVQRDQCHTDMDTNRRETAAADDKLALLASTNDTLVKDIGVANTAIAAEKKIIAETQASMKASSDTREAEKAAFEQTVSDHRLMFMILQKAIDRMKQVYVSALQTQSGDAHIKKSGADADPGEGPDGFEAYKQANGSRVVALLQHIQEDVKKTTDEALRDDQDAQAQYENLMSDSNGIISAAKEAITLNSVALAKKEEELSITNADISETDEDLNRLSTILNDLTKSCDYLLKNFDARQTARAQEIDALGEAKAILSGA